MASSAITATAVLASACPRSPHPHPPLQAPQHLFGPLVQLRQLVTAQWCGVVTGGSGRSSRHQLLCHEMWGRQPWSGHTSPRPPPYIPIAITAAEAGVPPPAARVEHQQFTTHARCSAPPCRTCSLSAVASRAPSASAAIRDLACGGGGRRERAGRQVGRLDATACSGPAAKRQRHGVDCLHSITPPHSTISLPTRPLPPLPPPPPRSTADVRTDSIGYMAPIPPCPPRPQCCRRLTIAPSIASSCPALHCIPSPSPCPPPRPTSISRDMSATCRCSCTTWLLYCCKCTPAAFAAASAATGPRAASAAEALYGRCAGAAPAGAAALRPKAVASGPLPPAAVAVAIAASLCRCSTCSRSRAFSSCSACSVRATT